MNSLNQPLTDDELDELAALLLDRIEDDDDVDGKDEGIVALEELDGFLTALVSGPSTIMISAWLPVVWGDFPPKWPTMQVAERSYGLLMRHQNGIVNTLMQAPEEFEPLFPVRAVNGKEYTIVDDWCEGYLRGVNLAGDAWEAGHPEVTTLLEPLRAFCEETDWRGHKLTKKAVQNLQACVAPNVRSLHRYWLERRTPLQPQQPLRRQAPRVGRNDPCPCASGRKYKQCCLQ
jgi:uncharacterized protein